MFEAVAARPGTPIPVVLDTPDIAAFIMGAAFLYFAVQSCCECLTGGNDVVEAYKAEKMKRQ